MCKRWTMTAQLESCEIASGKRVANNKHFDIIIKSCDCSSSGRNFAFRATSRLFVFRRYLSREVM